MSNTPYRGASRVNVKRMVQLAIFAALTILLAFTPLGYLHVNVMTITLVQIPVLIGAALMGPVAGGVLGFFFGLSSFILAPTDPVFALIMTHNPVMLAFICFIPRILVGVVGGFVARGLMRVEKTHLLAYGLSGALGAATNTVLVLGSIVLLYKDLAAEAMGVAGEAVLGVFIGVATTNGLLELGASAVIVAAVCRALESSGLFHQN